MNYEFVWLDENLKETRSVKKSSGCWGALGRSDYYRMNQTYRQEFLDFCKAANFSASAGGDSESYLQGESPDAIKIESRDFRQLFHKTNYDLMKYVVEESLFSFLFFGMDYETCYKNNSLYIDCNNAPAQIAATFLIWARDIFCSPDAGLCFTNLVLSGVDKGAALYLAVVCNGIYRGSPQRTYGEAMSSDAPLEVFVDNPSLETWNKYLHVYPRSLNEFKGYPTVLIQQWSRCKVKDLQRPQWYHAERLASSQKIAGIFGDIKFNGVVDVPQFIQRLFNK